MMKVTVLRRRAEKKISAGMVAAWKQGKLMSEKEKQEVKRNENLG